MITVKNKKVPSMISIVIPLLNEKENIRILYRELKEELDKQNFNYEIIFVDDCSTDNSFKVITNLLNQNNRIKTVRLKRQSGQSKALDAGFRVAKGKVIVVMDGDLQYDPADIPVLLKKMKEGYDVVCGWRYCRKDSINKKIMSWTGNFILNLIFKEKFHDVACGLKAFKKESLYGIDFFNGVHRFLLILCKMNGLKVAELKINHRCRRFGKSNYSTKNRILKFLKGIIVVKWTKRLKI